MPWHLEQRGKGWVVVTNASGRVHSKKPMPRARAVAQLRALYANEPGARVLARASRRSR